MGKSWEEMCQELVVDGRPGDVASAALGWEQLLTNLRSVQGSLERDVKDINTVWKGPAYEAFKEHVEKIAKDIEGIIKDAEKDDGVVHSLNDAADKLSKAQADFPVPTSCVNDVLEAREGRIHISAGFFEAKITPDFLGLLDPIVSVKDKVADFLFGKTEEAARVYNKAGNDYVNTAVAMPGEAGPGITRRPDMETPDLGPGPGGGPGPGRVPSIGGGPGGPGGLPTSPTTSVAEFAPQKGPGGGSLGEPGVPTPSTPTLGVPSPLTPGEGYGTPPKTEYGTGLAGATPAVGGGLAGGGGGLGGGLGTGGMGGGLGSGGGVGGGVGAGVIPGGGSLGRPVSPTMGMMGGMGGGAGAGGGARGAGKAGGSRAGGGMGGMGGMVGGAGGAGTRGAGARGGGAAGAGGARGMGAGAAGAMGGRGGMVGGVGSSAGYGGGEDVADRSSWLEEDEDVWGGGGGEASPGVLR